MDFVAFLVNRWGDYGRYIAYMAEKPVFLRNDLTGGGNGRIISLSILLEADWKRFQRKGSMP